MFIYVNVHTHVLLAPPFYTNVNLPLLPAYLQNSSASHHSVFLHFIERRGRKTMQHFRLKQAD